MSRCDSRIYKLKDFFSTIATYRKDARYRRQHHHNGRNLKAVKNVPPWKVPFGRLALLSRQETSQASSPIEIQFFENIVTSCILCLDAVLHYHQQRRARWNNACITGASEVHRTETVAEATAFRAGFLHPEMKKSRHSLRTRQRYRSLRNIFRLQATSSVWVKRNILEPKKGNQ